MIAIYAASFAVIGIEKLRRIILSFTHKNTQALGNSEYSQRVLSVKRLFKILIGKSKSFNLAIVITVAAVTGFGNAALADEDETLLCSVAERQDGKPNPILVLKVKERELNDHPLVRKNRKFLTCMLPNVDETVLIREILPRGSKRYEDAIILYSTQLEVAKQHFEARIKHDNFGGFGETYNNRGVELKKEICGYSDPDENGLHMKQIGNNPVCELATPEFYGRSDRGEIVHINCGLSKGSCLFIINYQDWYFKVFDIPDTLVDHWREVEKAILKDLEGRTVFRRSGGSCVGKACDVLERALN